MALIEKENRNPPTERRSDIDPVEVEEAFAAVITHQHSGYNGKPRRRPIRVQQIWDVFKLRRYTAVPLDELVEAFTDNNNPRLNVGSAISKLNKAFHELGFDIEITRTSYYSLHKRSGKSK